MTCCNSVYEDFRNRSMNSPLSTTGSGRGRGALRAAAGVCAGRALDAATTVIARAAAARRLDRVSRVGLVGRVGQVGRVRQIGRVGRVRNAEMLHPMQVASRLIAVMFKAP